MQKVRSQGKDLEEMPVNSGVAVDLYDVPLGLWPGLHPQGDNGLKNALKNATRGLLLPRHQSGDPGRHH